MGKKSLLHLSLIAAIGIIVYSNSLNAPFIWDDNNLILENTRLRDLSNFKDLSGTRYLTYLTFAINYAINRYDVTGYHIFNIAVHIMNSVLVYFLVRLIFRSQASALSTQQSAAGYKIALFSGLLFVAHPVYTQAVTYINQRSALLVTMFYLLSIIMYLKARLIYSSHTIHSPKTENYELKTANFRGKARIYMLYAISLISAVFAMKSKEIAFTLPFVILIFDRYFFGGQRGLKKSVIYLIPILLTMLIIPLDTPQSEVFNRQESGIFKIKDESVLSGLDARTLSSIPRKDYMVTQLRVILTYIRLFFFPVNLNLDYDYPVFSSFLSPSVFLSFIFLISLLALAVYLYYRSRPSAFRFQHSVGATLSEDPLRAFSMSLISFGILWFFISLSIESFVVVLNYVIFEYRLYLPSIGMILILMGVLSYIVVNYEKKIRYISAAIIAGVIIFSVATYMRNEVHKSDLTLWEDVIEKSPRRVMAYNNLGNAYMAKGRIDEAIQKLQTAARLKPNNAKVRNNLGFAYYNKGLLSEAIQEYKNALKLSPDFAEAHYNLGLAYYNQGKLNDAIHEYQVALRLNPVNAEVYNNLGNAYMVLDYVDDAIMYYQAALKLDPNLAGTHNNLGLAYKQKGLIDEAIQEFQTALKIDSGLVQALQNMESLRKQKP